MLVLPDIASAPRVLGARGGDARVAKLALTFPDEAPLAGVHVRDGFETAALQRQLEAWQARSAKVLRRFVCPVHLTVAKDDFSLWLGSDVEDERDPIGAQWILEARWKALEAIAPGLAAAALVAIGRAGWRSLPVYTPALALDWAMFTWWHCSEDEKDVLAEWREARLEGGEPAEDGELPDGLVTRAQLDRVLPRAVTQPKPMPAARLADLARGRGEAAEVARATLALQSASRRRVQCAFEQDVEDIHCRYFAGTLRWNRRDGMGRIFDDHVHDLMGCEAVERAYGLCIRKAHGELPELLADAERVFALARQVEDLASMIATEAR